ncbi:hypothetical protein EON83_11975 [bacterium]|nr:MAG: hypothetical protein EON83_11975 [bacterium]
MAVSVRPATEADFADILALQNDNYIDNVAVEDRGEGFVSTPFSLELLEELEFSNRFYIARDEATGAMAGYVFTGSWRFCARWPAFEIAIARFPIQWKGQPVEVDDTFQYGPVCVARDYRGQGVLPLLFDAVKVAMRDDFAVGTTWINAANGRSMNAHVNKLGLAPLDEWQWQDKNFVLLGFETRG